MQLPRANYDEWEMISVKDSHFKRSPLFDKLGAANASDQTLHPSDLAAE